MRRIALLLTLTAATAACRPDHWLGVNGARLSQDQQTALASYERAAIGWRTDLAAGAPIAKDQQHITALTTAAKRFLQAGAGSISPAQAEIFLENWTRDFLTRSASQIPNAKIRLRAVASAHRWAPRASSHLP